MIVGPTAVGKTTVAIDIATRLNTEIISVDSRQCYKELKIGVATPSDEDLQRVTHHFITSHSIHQEVTAADFEQYALQKAEEIFKKKDCLVMAGGTGLYVKAFCEGLDEIPAVDAGIRNLIIKNYVEKGMAWLQAEVKIKDPAFYEAGEILNPQRMMRALEVREATGKSILEFRTGKKADRNFQIVKIGLELPKEELHRNINARVDKMMRQGLMQEASSLLPYRNLNALQTVGYTEMFDYLDGKISLQQAIELIKIHTRQYAKRQMTWFKKDKEIYWFSPASQSILSFLSAASLSGELNVDSNH